MTTGHRQAQLLWDQLGRNLGYEPARSAGAPQPADGVWFPASAAPRFAHRAFAAIEVVVSESPKTLRGSIVTLECISPSLAVVLIHEEEIRRHAVRRGLAVEVALNKTRLLSEEAHAIASRSRQHIEIWSFAQLQRRVRQTSGAPVAAAA